MKKTQLTSLLLGIGLLSGIGLGASHIPSSNVSNSKNVRLLSNNSNYACVVNGNGNLSLTNKNGQVIGYVSVGEMLTLKQSSNDKTLVTVHETGMTGYLKNSNIKDITSAVGQDLIKMNKQGYVINVSTTLHVRANATMNSEILTNLSNNTSLAITGKVGNWYKVNVNGVNGYIFDEYISEGSNIQSNNVTTSNNTKETSIAKTNKVVSNTTSNNVNNTANNKKNSNIQNSVSSNTEKTQSNATKSQSQNIDHTSTKNNNDNNSSETLTGNGIVKKLGNGEHRAHLHTEPSSSSAGPRLEPGTHVQILGETQEFYHVKITSGVYSGDTGYIYAPYVERV